MTHFFDFLWNYLTFIFFNQCQKSLLQFGSQKATLCFWQTVAVCLTADSPCWTCEMQISPHTPIRKEQTSLKSKAFAFSYMHLCSNYALLLCSTENAHIWLLKMGTLKHDLDWQAWIVLENAKALWISPCTIIRALTNCSRTLSLQPITYSVQPWL